MEFVTFFGGLDLFSNIVYDLHSDVESKIQNFIKNICEIKKIMIGL